MNFNIRILGFILCLLVGISSGSSHARWFFQHHEKKRAIYKTWCDGELAERTINRYIQLRRFAEFKVDSRFKNYAFDLKNLKRKSGLVKLKLKISNAYLTISPIAEKIKYNMLIRKDERKELQEYWKKSNRYMSQLAKYKQLVPFDCFEDLERFLDMQNVPYDPRDLARTMQNMVRIKRKLI